MGYAMSIHPGWKPEGRLGWDELTRLYPETDIRSFVWRRQAWRRVPPPPAMLLVQSVIRRPVRGEEEWLPLTVRFPLTMVNGDPNDLGTGDLLLAQIAACLHQNRSLLFPVLTLRVGQHEAGPIPVVLIVAPSADADQRDPVYIAGAALVQFIMLQGRTYGWHDGPFWRLLRRLRARRGLPSGLG